LFIEIITTFAMAVLTTGQYPLNQPLASEQLITTEVSSAVWTEFDVSDIPVQTTRVNCLAMRPTYRKVKIDGKVRTVGSNKYMCYIRFQRGYGQKQQVRIFEDGSWNFVPGTLKILKRATTTHRS
jgi:hypothetical protein